MSVLTLNVDEVMRTLSAESSNPFVVHDKEVDIVRFAINSGFADIVLDGQVALRVMYQRPGESEVRAQTLTYYDTDGLHNYYDWQLSQSDLTKNGSLMVALCILDISGGEVSEWHTTPCVVRVLSTIHTDDSDEGDDTITPTVKERVAVLETMIQRVASGAPIVVSSTSAMTDTDQIYVLSTDGKWYYHNGTTWTAGGEYGGVLAGSITTAKIADGAVTTAKIADGAVTGAKVGTGTLTGDNIANKAIGTAKIDDGAVTWQKLASGAVHTGELVDSAVTNVKLADSSVSEGKLASGAVTATKLADGAVTAGKIASGVIPAVDATLTQTGAAADAKATGNSFEKQNERTSRFVETLDVTMLEKGGWSSGKKDEYRSANRARTKTFLYAAKSINVYRKHTHNEAQIYVTFYTISGEILSSVKWTGSVLIPKRSIFTLMITESNSSSTERTVDELYDMFHVSITDNDVISDYDSDQWTFSAGYISSNSNMMFDENLKMSIDQYFVADHRFAHFDCASGYTLSLIGYDDNFSIVKTASQFGSKTGNVFVDMEGCAFFRVTVTCPNADVTEQDVIDSVSISKNGSTGVGNTNIISISKDGINDENKDYAPKYPKSSLVSLRKAYEQGFRDVFLHVQFTSDNIPVVYHDPYINRYARNADGSTIQTTINIKDTTLEVLNTYDFGIVFGEQYRGTKITVFEDALILCKNLGFKIWIEPTTTLSDSEENIVFDMMKKYGMDCHMAFFSYYLSGLVRAHQKVPRADLLFHPSGDTSELEENLVANIDNLSALIDKNDVYAYVSGGLTDETKMMLKNAGIKRMVQCLSGFEPTNIEGQLINNKDCNAVVTQIMPAYSVNM